MMMMMLSLRQIQIRTTILGGFSGPQPDEILVVYGQHRLKHKSPLCVLAAAAALSSSSLRYKLIIIWLILAFSSSGSGSATNAMAAAAGSIAKSSSRRCSQEKLK